MQRDILDAMRDDTEYWVPLEEGDCIVTVKIDGKEADIIPLFSADKNECWGIKVENSKKRQSHLLRPDVKEVLQKEKVKDFRVVVLRPVPVKDLAS